jgi:hypothetical protein
MTLKSFIRKNRAEINTVIRRECAGIRLNDAERRLWILNLEPLYLWARRSGVKEI